MTVNDPQTVNYRPLGASTTLLYVCLESRSFFIAAPLNMSVEVVIRVPKIWIIIPNTPGAGTS